MRLISYWNILAEKFNKGENIKMKIELPYEVVDKVIAEHLSEAYYDLGAMIDSLMEKDDLKEYEQRDLEDHINYRNAIKITLEYFGVTV